MYLFIMEFGAEGTVGVMGVIAPDEEDALSTARMVMHSNHVNGSITPPSQEDGLNNMVRMQNTKKFQVAEDSIRGMAFSYMHFM